MMRIINNSKNWCHWFSCQIFGL